MKIISGTVEFQMQEPSAVVIGKFDGIHLGHRLLLEKLIEQKREGLQTVVFTFDKSPATLFLKEGEVYREICSSVEKREIFEEISKSGEFLHTEAVREEGELDSECIDVLIEFPMNAGTAAISPEEFITEILQKKLCCKSLIAGDDITFGYKGRGNSNLLREYSKKCGYQLHLMDKLLVNNVLPETGSAEEISSTLIRREINAGNIAKANRLLGRCFTVTGKVQHGRKLAGSILHMPTANLKWPEHKVLPAFGVYMTEVLVDGRRYKAITNVGRKPTVNAPDMQEVLAESYLYDYCGDLYGKIMQVCFYEFVRSEQKFENLEALQEQMLKDMEQGRRWQAEENKR